MKGRIRIFDLSNSEQRVILIVMLVLITIAFIRYECRLHRFHTRAPTVPEVKTSPSREQIDEEQ
jgi:hypothetical protein